MWDCIKDGKRIPCPYLPAPLWQERHKWMEEETSALIEMRISGMPVCCVARELHLTEKSVNTKIDALRKSGETFIRKDRD